MEMSALARFSARVLSPMTGNPCKQAFVVAGHLNWDARTFLQASSRKKCLKAHTLT